MKKIYNLLFLSIPFLVLLIMWLNFQIYNENVYAPGLNKYKLYWFSSFIIYFSCLVYLFALKKKFHFKIILIGLIEFIIPIMIIALNDLWFIIFYTNLSVNIIVVGTVIFIYLYFLLDVHKSDVRKG